MDPALVSAAIGLLIEGIKEVQAIADAIAAAKSQTAWTPAQEATLKAASAAADARWASQAPKAV